MSLHAELLDNPAFVADLLGTTVAPAIASKWGVGATFVKTHRRLARANGGQPVVTKPAETTPGDGYKFDVDLNGNVNATTKATEQPQTITEAEQLLRLKGIDPDLYNVSYGWSEWEQSSKDGGTRTLYASRIRATPKPVVAGAAAIHTADLHAAIDSWAPAEMPIPTWIVPETLVVCAADFQAGKTDFGLTSADLTNRVLASFAAAAQIATDTRFAEIVIADLGDIVENINSTSSQRATNDLAITEQIRLARRLMLEGIKMLAPLTDSLVYAAVPSNHGSVRIGPKSPENHVLDDYGIEIAEQLRDVCAESDKLSNVSFVTPEQSYESLALTTSGTTLGMAHGHQAQGADGLSKFWQGQSHGRMPLAQADIALFGHFHSLRVQQSGDARWLMVSPASDNGSSWFTNKTGERSKAGMLSFVTSNGAWSDLKVL